MGRMTSALFESSPLLLLPLIGLGIFFAVFVLTLIRTYAVRASTYDERAALALDEGDKQ